MGAEGGCALPVHVECKIKYRLWVKQNITLPPKKEAFEVTIHNIGNFKGGEGLKLSTKRLLKILLLCTSHDQYTHYLQSATLYMLLILTF